jgi:hypothetical protein
VANQTHLLDKQGYGNYFLDNIFRFMVSKSLHFLKTHWFYCIVGVELAMFGFFSVGYYVNRDSMLEKQVAGVSETKASKSPSSRFLAYDIQNYLRTSAAQSNLSNLEFSRLTMYSSTAYYQAYSVNKSTSSGLFAVQKVLDFLLPAQTNNHSLFVQSHVNTAKNDLDLNETERVSRLFGNMYNDGFNIPWNGILKVGDRTWKPQENQAPMFPAAGSWVKSTLSKDILPDRYPDYILNEQTLKSSATATNTAMTAATANQKNTISYWLAGEFPQSRLNERLYEELQSVSLSEEDFAWNSMVLSQIFYDSYITTWKIKYDISTPRPNQINSFITPVPTPNSPSFVSEYGAISGAFEIYVREFFAEKTNAFTENLNELKTVGFIAGIEHEEDGRVGFDIGKRVAKSVIEQIGEKP